MVTRSRTALLVALLSAFVALGGLGAGAKAAPSATSAADTVVIAAAQGPDVLDPIASSLYSVDAMVWSSVYDTLVKTTLSGDVEPRVATSWTVSNDARRYVFKLRRNVRFHDRTRLTAKDVVFSLGRAMKNGIPLVKQRFANVQSFAAPGAYTVVVQLRNPDNTFLYTLGDPSGIAVAILSRRNSANAATRPMGSGPFRFVSYTPNSQLVLERNDRYWNPAEIPGYRRLQIRFITEDASQVAALRSGAASLIQPVTVATTQSLSSDRSLRVLAHQSLGFWISLSRVGRTAPDNVARAVALAIDREALIRVAFLGQARAGSTASPYLKYGVPLSRLPNYTRNVTEARRLLSVAGFPNGISLTFIYPTRAPFTNTMFEVLQDSLADAGIRLTLQPLEQQVWLTRFLNANYDLSVTDQGWYANPVRYVLPRVGWQAPPSQIVPSLEGLIQQFQAAPANQRPALFQQIQRLEAQEAYPFIGTVWVNRGVIYRKDRLNEARPGFLVSADQRGFFLSLKPK